MTPEELDEATVKEAKRRWDSSASAVPDIATIAARLAREGWTPPEPEPVDPDLLAFREWAAEIAPALGAAEAYQRGLSDNTHYARCFRAGARMAREQERERAKLLVEYVQDRRYEDAQADRLLAKYRGEA